MLGSESGNESCADDVLQADDESSPVRGGSGVGGRPTPNAVFGFFLVIGTVTALALTGILWLTGLLVHAGSR